METVIITGGTGLVGEALTAFLLERGYKVIILTRKPEAGKNKAVTYAHWDVKAQTIDKSAIGEADYIVHLAGANVGEKRWTEARKREIVESRTQSSELIYTALKDIPNKIKKVISASATGYYGDYTDHVFTETDPPATDYLGTTTRLWEEHISKVSSLNKKLVILRTGIVLSTEGGALKEFYKPLRFGFATILGSGEQFVPWIHIHDLVRIYFSAIVDDKMQGIFNAVGPNPVSNKELILTMAKVVKGKSFMTTHVPSFALKLALGEMSVEVLKSVKASPNKIMQAGFQFSYPTIEPAMEQLFSR